MTITKTSITSQKEEKLPRREGRSSGSHRGLWTHPRGGFHSVPLCRRGPAARFPGGHVCLTAREGGLWWYRSLESGGKAASLTLPPPTPSPLNGFLAWEKRECLRRIHIPSCYKRLSPPSLYFGGCRKKRKVWRGVVPSLYFLICS